MKDYKKILEGVVNIINTTEKSDIGFTNICNYIGEKCPELTNEDERIRKEIIATIHLYYGEPLEDEAKEMIAWLEKQGVKPDGCDAFIEKAVRRLKHYLDNGMWIANDVGSAEKEAIIENFRKYMKEE